MILVLLGTQDKPFERILKAVAKEIGGKQTKNSGATLFQKSDVYTDLFNLECKTKTTNSDSISIKSEWFEKQIKEMLANKNNDEAEEVKAQPAVQKAPVTQTRAAARAKLDIAIDDED